MIQVGRARGSRATICVELPGLVLEAYASQRHRASEFGGIELGVLSWDDNTYPYSRLNKELSRLAQAPEPRGSWDLLDGVLAWLESAAPSLFARAHELHEWP